MSLKGKKVLGTGAVGFIGSHPAIYYPGFEQPCHQTWCLSLTRDLNYVKDTAAGFIAASQSGTCFIID